MDVSKISINEQVYNIKDVTARNDAATAKATADTAKATADTAKVTADTALEKTTELEQEILTARYADETLYFERRI